MWGLQRGQLAWGAARAATWRRDRQRRLLRPTLPLPRLLAARWMLMRVWAYVQDSESEIFVGYVRERKKNGGRRAGQRRRCSWFRPCPVMALALRPTRSCTMGEGLELLFISILFFLADRSADEQSKMQLSTVVIVSRHIRMLSATVLVPLLAPLSNPASLISWRCGYTVLAVREILLPRLLLHRLWIPTKLPDKPRVDVRLYGLLRGHELLLHGRIRLRKAVL